MNIDYRKLWHFCDYPVCPDPVWKLSSTRTAARALLILDASEVKRRLVLLVFLSSALSWIHLRRKQLTYVFILDASNLYKQGLSFLCLRCI